MELDPDTARNLFSEGAFLIVAGIPLGTEFGIDLCSYKIGEKFRGIKMIPPGIHFIYCSSQGLYGEAAPRVGFVHYFKSQEILVREWDAENEELRIRQTANLELEISRIKENIKDLDRFLGPYDLRYYTKWLRLTNTITEETIKKHSPDCGVVRTNIQLLSCPDSERPRGNITTGINKLNKHITVNENDLLPDLEPVEGTAPKFTKLPNRVPKDSSPADISRHHLDSITCIDQYFSQFEEYENVIQEIQILFVFFYIGWSYESLNQWRKILNVLSNSETAIKKYKLFFMKYLEILQYQLPELPEELMQQNDKNTVYKDVRNLILNASLGGLTVNANRLILKLNKTMKWTFDGLLDEDPEYMPVIVED